MTATPSRLSMILLIAGMAVLGILAGALAWRMFDARGPEPQVLIELPEPRVVADFALVDDAGQPFSLDDLKGRWSVLFFGFTNCPDICPDTLYQLQQARAELVDRLPPERMPVIYLVSVDPDRDTPEKLAGYLEYFDPEFVGLTGPDPQLRALTMQLGVMYHVAPHGREETNYLVDHSASLLVLDPEGRLHGVLPAPHSAETIAADLTALLRRAERG